MKKNVKVTNVSDDEEEEKIQINFFLLLSFLHSRGQWACVSYTNFTLFPYL